MKAALTILILSCVALWFLFGYVIKEYWNDRISQAEKNYLNIKKDIEK